MAILKTSCKQIGHQIVTWEVILTAVRVHSGPENLFRQLVTQETEQAE